MQTNLFPLCLANQNQAVALPPDVQEATRVLPVATEWIRIDRTCNGDMGKRFFFVFAIGRQFSFSIYFAVKILIFIFLKIIMDLHFKLFLSPYIIGIFE